MEELIHHLKPMQVFSAFCPKCNRYRYMEYEESFDDEVIFDKPRMLYYLKHGTSKVSIGRCFKCKYRFRTGRKI